MGVFDKLKNALFEVEYVEVEDKPKKEKPVKSKEKSKDTTEKPIAKKIVLPGKREEKVEKIQEEEMKDDNFEIRPINETIKENLGPTFKFMDDEDFAMEDNRPVEASPRDSVIPNVLDDSENDRISTRSERRTPVQSSPYDRPIHAADANTYEKTVSIEDNNSFERPVQAAQDNSFERPNYSASEEEPAKVPYDNMSKDREPYGVDSVTFKAAKDYGSYENKDEKTYFKPSPIISPIYGILDKNYRKEDVVSKKEIRITTNYSRTNVNVDDIRDKAYGVSRESIVPKEVVPEPVIQTPSFEVEEEDDEPLLVDLSDEKEKPEVKAITVGDAMEYFDDLGLEYNVDYVDASNKNKKKNNGLEEEIKYNMDSVVKEEAKPIPAPVPVPEVKIVDSNVTKSTPVVEVKEESSNNVVDDDDNLFDLIDSMYKDDEE